MIVANYVSRIVIQDDIFTPALQFSCQIFYAVVDLVSDIVRLVCLKIPNSYMVKNRYVSN